jgi:hypothetical protein
VIELQASSYTIDDGQSWKSLPQTAGSFGHRSTSMPCGCVLTTTQVHHRTTTSNKGTFERSRTSQWPPFNFAIACRGSVLLSFLQLYSLPALNPPGRYPSTELARDICSRNLAMGNMCQPQGETNVALLRIVTSKKMLRVRP